MKTQKNRGGRPPKGSGERQDAYLDVRLKQSEKQTFQDAANLAGLPVATWVRERLRSAALRELQAAGQQVAFLNEKVDKRGKQSAD